MDCLTRFKDIRIAIKNSAIHEAIFNDIRNQYSYLKDSNWNGLLPSDQRTINKLSKLQNDLIQSHSSNPGKITLPKPILKKIINLALGDKTIVLSQSNTDAETLFHHIHKRCRALADQKLSNITLQTDKIQIRKTGVTKSVGNELTDQQVVGYIELKVYLREHGKTLSSANLKKICKAYPDPQIIDIALTILLNKHNEQDQDAEKNIAYILTHCKESQQITGSTLKLCHQILLHQKTLAKQEHYPKYHQKTQGRYYRALCLTIILTLIPISLMITIPWVKKLRKEYQKFVKIKLSENEYNNYKNRNVEKIQNKHEKSAKVKKYISKPNKKGDVTLIMDKFQYDRFKEKQKMQFINNPKEHDKNHEREKSIKKSNQLVFETKEFYKLK